MPVRSLNSSVLKWPDRDAVDRAVRKWAAKAARDRQDVIRIGYFGSYARGNWGPGSDVDLVIIVEQTGKKPWERGREWDAADLPVPAEVLVYAKDEWEGVRDKTRMGRTINREAVWVYIRPGPVLSRS